MVISPCTVNTMENWGLQPENVPAPNIKILNHKPIGIEEKISFDKNLDKINKETEHPKTLPVETDELETDELVIEEILNSPFYKKYLKEFEDLKLASQVIFFPDS